jgi:methyl-accepting chemotaxis protein
VDIPGALIGFFGGAMASFLLVWRWLYPQLEAARRRGERHDRELRSARAHILELSQQAVGIVSQTGHSLMTISSELRDLLEQEKNAISEVEDGVNRLGSAGSGGDPEEQGGQLGGTERAVEELAERHRSQLGAVRDLERLIGQLFDACDALAGDEQAAENRLTELTAAASDTMSAASTMDDAIRNLENYANETAQLSAQVSSEAERGYRAVHRTLDQIERIRDITAISRERIVSLGERVAGISHVVRVIQEVTEKTNLLALNASIIAAQAGEHGRSFAVVAREIKALAQKTAASTKEIGEQIRSVQDESDRATAAMSDGVNAVSEGFQVAVAAGDALGSIRERALSAQKRVQSMTRAFKQQASAAQRVVENATTVLNRANAFLPASRAQQSAGQKVHAAGLDAQRYLEQLTRLMREQTTQFQNATTQLAELIAKGSSGDRRGRDGTRQLGGLRAALGRNRTLQREALTRVNLLSNTASELQSKSEELSRP